MRRLDRVAAARALASPLVAFAGILLAALFASGFSPAASAFVALTALATVGVFASDTALHAPVAVTFYLPFTATVGPDGTTSIFGDDAVGELKRVAATIQITSPASASLPSPSAPGFRGAYCPQRLQSAESGRQADAS